MTASPALLPEDCDVVMGPTHRDNRNYGLVWMREGLNTSEFDAMSFAGIAQAVRMWNPDDLDFEARFFLSDKRACIIRGLWGATTLPTGLPAAAGGHYALGWIGRPGPAAMDPTGARLIAAAAQGRPLALVTDSGSDSQVRRDALRSLPGLTYSTAPVADTRFNQASGLLAFDVIATRHRAWAGGGLVQIREWPDPSRWPVAAADEEALLDSILADQGLFGLFSDTSAPIASSVALRRAIRSAPDHTGPLTVLHDQLTRARAALRAWGMAEVSGDLDTKARASLVSAPLPDVLALGPEFYTSVMASPASPDAGTQALARRSDWLTLPTTGLDLSADQASHWVGEFAQEACGAHTNRERCALAAMALWCAAGAPDSRAFHESLLRIEADGREQALQALIAANPSFGWAALRHRVRAVCDPFRSIHTALAQCEASMASAPLSAETASAMNQATDLIGRFWPMIGGVFFEPIGRNETSHG